MAQERPSQFLCPKCRASYKVVRVKSGPQPILSLPCKVCDGPLRATDGENILKYFLVARQRGAPCLTLASAPEIDPFLGAVICPSYSAWAKV